MAQGTIASGDGGRYEGEVRGRKPHGQGVMTYSNGARHEGEFRDGLQSGPGSRAGSGSV